MEVKDGCRLPSLAALSRPELLLVVGGSGYLGLHLLQAFSHSHSSLQLAFTYFSHPPPPSLSLALPHVPAFKVDLRSGEGFDAISATLGPPFLFLGNVNPVLLLLWLLMFPTLWCCGFPLSQEPVLHCLFIYLQIKWITGVLSNGKGSDFFHDEYRCPVFVKDVVKVVELVLKKEASGPGFLRLLLNVGGPQRLSRAEMAEVVAKVRGFNTALIRHISVAAVNRGVASPPDISMDMSRLTSVLDIVLTSFLDGVKLTFASQH